LKALVTGGSGFLGGALARRLVALGHCVRTFSRRAVPELVKLGADSRIGDIRDPQAVAGAAVGMDVIFHTAAMTGIWGKRRDYLDTNATGTVNVIAACHRHGVQKLVFTSSPSVVGSGHAIEGVDESAPYPLEYSADYPETKARAERLVLAANQHVVPSVALRPHLIWGPGDPNLVARIVSRARAGRLRVVGDGRNRVDTVYIDNAVDAHVLAEERLAAGSPIAGKVYFISNGEPLAMEDLLNRILAAAHLPPVARRMTLEGALRLARWLERAHRWLRIQREPLMTKFLAEQLAYPHWFNIAAARRELGYEVRVSIDEGMRRLQAWLSGCAGSRPAA
jgi:nucleoside-diphosphate-sugar epimerase